MQKCMNIVQTPVVFFVVVLHGKIQYLISDVTFLHSILADIYPFLYKIYYTVNKGESSTI